MFVFNEHLIYASRYTPMSLSYEQSTKNTRPDLEQLTCLNASHRGRSRIAKETGWKSDFSDDMFL